MFNRQTASIIIVTLIVAFAVFAPPQTTHRASAHDVDPHVYPSFQVQIVKWGIVYALTCTSFIPEGHMLPWPFKICVPGIDEVAIGNGCLGSVYI